MVATSGQGGMPAPDVLAADSVVNLTAAAFGLANTFVCGPPLHTAESAIRKENK